MKLSRFFCNLSLALSLTLTPLSVKAETTKAPPKIQIAILLDSSNSMDGLIDQTRQEIWKVVNALTKVRKDGKVPILEVALYHYGNDSLPASEGFNRLMVNMTPELDAVSEQLFAIHTNGGQEYTGWVIESAIRQLNWSKRPQDFRAIFIAGNEPFDQGTVDWQEAVNLAKEHDTLVNTIYCGSAESQERDLWAKGALMADSATFNINQDRPVVFIPSPFDDDITKLNQKLNETYIPYGSDGTRGQARQMEQDSNAGAQIVTRGAAKSSSYYRNSSWDLVDAVDEGVVNLKSANAETLPEPMQNLSPAEREAYVQKVKKERAEIQAQIQDLSNQRTAYLEKLPPDQGAENDTLDYVMIQALRQQLADKGFVLK